MKGLQHEGKPTEVIFGFLKSISFLKDEFLTDRIAFCFEHPHLFRRDIYPPYKRRRAAKERTPAEKQDYSNLIRQITQLRKQYLPSIGFRNVFCFRGMESDDIMAALARDCSNNEEAILVTADSDLYQCLRENVHIYSPQKQKLLTNEWFYQTYGIWPGQWAMVKAIAGCHGDEVAGIKGVGEVTALKWCRGELGLESKAYKSIISPAGKAIVRRNRPLVQLPYEGCPSPELQEDCVTREAWVKTCGLLGMRSISGHPPIATRKLGKI